MAEQLTLKMIDNVAIDSTPNRVIGSTLTDQELEAMLDGELDASHGSDEVIEVLPPQDVTDLLAGIDLTLPEVVPAGAPVTVAAEPLAQPKVEEHRLDDSELEALVAASLNTESALASSTSAAVSAGAVPVTAADGSNALHDVHSDPLSVLAELEAMPVTGAPAAAATEKTETEKKARTPALPRKHYTDKAERLKDRVGDELATVSMLTPDDAAMPPAEGIERTLEIIKGMNKKEQNRASNLVEFVTGKGKSLNGVLERLIRLLHKDGYLQTGEKGNVMADLLSRPYSPASARAMGANTVAVFADLYLLKADTKGKYVANPESVLLAICKEKLGLK